MGASKQVSVSDKVGAGGEPRQDPTHYGHKDAIQPQGMVYLPFKFW